METSKRNLIASIYIYFFTGVGLIMLLIGSFQLVQFGVKKTLLPKYYLQDWQESRCDAFTVPAVAPADKNTAQTDAKQMEEQAKKCKIQVEEQRNIQQVIDLSTALTLIILGAATFAFHYRKTKLQ